MPVSLPSSTMKRLGGVVDDDVDAFFFGVVELPGRGFEVAAGAAGHHFNVLTAEAARGTAAVHGGVADADDEDLFADGIEVAEGDGAEPVDADVDSVGIVTAGKFEVFAAGRTAAYKDGVEALIVLMWFKQSAQTVDG